LHHTTTAFVDRSTVHKIGKSAEGVINQSLDGLAPSTGQCGTQFAWQSFTQRPANVGITLCGSNYKEQRLQEGVVA
jgi:hypothetical protein